jgi:hypothetical protein
MEDPRCKYPGCKYPKCKYPRCKYTLFTLMLESGLCRILEAGGGNYSQVWQPTGIKKPGHGPGFRKGYVFQLMYIARQLARGHELVDGFDQLTQPASAPGIFSQCDNNIFVAIGFN